jgi:tRNA 2-thiouridine synthesizing protein A
MSEPLDLRGLKCPLPALMSRRALAHAAPGTELEVITNDPMAAVDIPHMCHHEGFTVLRQARDGSETRFVLRR